MEDVNRDINEREDTRRKIKSNATNLCTHVVNTCVEFKEELINLEKDNLKLKRKNKNLKNQIKNLKEQNQLLYDELIKSQNRIYDMIKSFGVKNVCYNCDHFLSCGDVYLCVYCKKWVCSCCVLFCKEELGLDKMGDTIYCIVSICDSCCGPHDKCPSHSDLPKELSSELIEYYQDNKYKKP